MDNSKPKIERHFCNGCQQKTRHVQRASHTKRYTMKYYEDEWAEVTWSLWECLGCDEVFARESWISTLDATDRMEPSVSFHPPRTSHVAKKKEYRSIPDGLDDIYAEVIQTFNAEAHILCAGGLRALLEGICVDKDASVAGSQTRFADKIRVALKSHVHKKVLDNLNAFPFLGNNALHELKPPKRPELALAIEVIEDVLNAIYELDYKSARLYRLVTSGSKMPRRES